MLLATGAQTNFRELLPRDKKVDVQLLTQTVLFLELNDADIQLLRNMPSMICEGSGKFGCYILPPIRYPDGKVYLKLGTSSSPPPPTTTTTTTTQYLSIMTGHGSEFEKELHTMEEVVEWYKGQGSPEACKSLRATIDALIPGLQPLSTRSDACVTTHTPTGHLYIDMIKKGFGVVVPLVVVDVGFSVLKVFFL